jgi:hypothetical protein
MPRAGGSGTTSGELIVAGGSDANSLECRGLRSGSRRRRSVGLRDRPRSLDEQAVDERLSPVITLVLADHHHLIREGCPSLLETKKDFKVAGEVADGLTASASSSAASREY